MPHQPVTKTTARLMELLSILPDKAPGATSGTLTELGREKFKWTVHKRTVDRNLASLREAGLAQTLRPSTKRKHPNEQQHWIAEPGKTLNAPRMGTPDALALHLIERVADSLLPPEIVNVLRNRMEGAKTHLERRRKVDQEAAWAKKISVLPDGFSLCPPAVDEAILHSLQRALLTDKKIMCSYQANPKATVKRYPLEPRALVLRGSLLYLIASRPDNPAKKTTWYRVNRFKAVHMLEQRIGRSDFQLDQFLKSAEGEFGAQGSPIAFRAWVSSRLEAQLAESPLSHDMTLVPAKGGAIVTATVWQSWPFESWILGRGRDIRVMEPASLRDATAERLRLALDAYEAA